MRQVGGAFCLKYDARAGLAEYQFYRSDEAEEMEQEGDMDIEIMALNAKLKGGVICLCWI